jgi:predicted ester cyclase
LTRFAHPISCFTHQTGQIGREESRARKLVIYGRQLYRDARTTLDDIIAENDKVAVRWTITGTWIGQQRPGFPPYGERVAVGSMSWYRFVDGKIVEDWGTEVFWPTGTPESEIAEWRSTR